jgi:hypothetical protein
MEQLIQKIREEYGVTRSAARGLIIGALDDASVIEAILEAIAAEHAKQQ